ncbi:MAG: gluconate 2-dehydrogenase subunit 3 family protein [Thaumarchaeota archaeon]|nr:gluconate 2-dehydrogenase subunit 3 family protein [Nitrososphaerota archaeon]
MPERSERFYFLSSEEAEFFKAFCSIIVPSGETESDPGSREVGSVNYVDSTLFDFPKEVQDYFRGIIELVNQRSRTRFLQRFAGLSDFDKSWVIRELFLDPKTREKIFDLRSMALEGFYSDYHDPWYGGVTPWELVKFGGRRISGLKKDWSFLKIWKDETAKEANKENAT